MNQDVYDLLNDLSMERLTPNNITHYINNDYPKHISILLSLKKIFSQPSINASPELCKTLITVLIKKHVLESIYMCVIPFKRLPFIYQILTLLHDFLLIIGNLTSNYKSPSFNNYLINSLYTPNPEEYNILSLLTILLTENSSPEIKILIYNTFNLILKISSPTFFFIISKNEPFLEKVLFFPSILHNITAITLDELAGRSRKPRVPRSKLNIPSSSSLDPSRRASQVDYSEIFSCSFSTIYTPTPTQSLVRSYFSFLNEYLKNFIQPFISVSPTLDLSNCTETVLRIVNKHEHTKILLFLIEKTSDEIVRKHCLDIWSIIHTLIAKKYSYNFTNEINETIINVFKVLTNKLSFLFSIKPQDLFSLHARNECIFSAFNLISKFCFSNKKIQLHFFTTSLFGFITKLFEANDKELKFRGYEVILSFFYTTTELAAFKNSRGETQEEDKLLYMFLNKSKIFENCLEELKKSILEAKYSQVLFRIICRLITLNEPVKGHEMVFKEFKHIKNNLVYFFENLTKSKLEMQISVIESLVCLLRSKKQNCNANVKEEFVAVLCQCGLAAFLVRVLGLLEKMWGDNVGFNEDIFGIVFDCLVLVVKFNEHAVDGIVRSGVVGKIGKIADKCKGFSSKVGGIMAMISLCKNKRDKEMMLKYMFVKHKELLDKVSV